MRLLAAAVLLFQTPDRAELRAGLDTLYGGDFPAAAAHFERLAARDSADPAPLVFQAGAYIWWAAARDSAAFERQRIDSLLGLAIDRARAAPPPPPPLAGPRPISGAPPRSATARASGICTGSRGAPRRTPRRCGTSTAACSRLTPPAWTATSGSACTTMAWRGRARSPGCSLG